MGKALSPALGPLVKGSQPQVNMGRSAAGKAIPRPSRKEMVLAGLPSGLRPVTKLTPPEARTLKEWGASA